MAEYNEIQKSFIKYLLKYKKKAIEIKISNVVYKFLEENYPEFKINIMDNEVKFLKKKDKQVKDSYIKIDEIISLLYLLRVLKEEKYIIFYGEEDNQELKEDNYFYAFNIDIDFSDVKRNLNQKFLIDPKLRELKSRNFNSIEQKNLNFTKCALIISIVANIFGFYWQWHVATKVNTVIEFSNFEDLKYISELIKNLSK